MSSSDGRRIRGDRTRQRAAHAVAMAASVDGLESTSIGSVAQSTGLSKSSIMTVFGTREALLIAAVDEAQSIYMQHVITPALAAEPGEPRLRAVVEAWTGYVRRHVFPGGCFLTTVAMESAGRRGPVADRVRVMKRDWLRFLESEFHTAGSSDAAGAAFVLDALLAATQQRVHLLERPAELDIGRRLAMDSIGVSADKHGGRKESGAR